MSNQQIAVSSRIGVVFLLSGVFALIFSVIDNVEITAFVGLGLTFWGAVFLLVSPRRLVQASLLEASAVSAYSTIDRIIKDFKYSGKSFYIPSYPKDVYLPEHLKGLKETTLFISETENYAQMPSIEEIAGSKFQLTKTRGVLVVPPGIGLVTKLERASHVDFTKIKLDEAPRSPPQTRTR